MTETDVLAVKYDQLKAIVKEKQTFIQQLSELIDEIELEIEHIRYDMDEINEQIQS